MIAAMAPAPAPTPTSIVSTSAAPISTGIIAVLHFDCWVVDWPCASDVLGASGKGELGGAIKAPASGFIAYGGLGAGSWAFSDIVVFKATVADGSEMVIRGPVPSCEREDDGSATKGRGWRVDCVLAFLRGIGG
jgi:hypothetical protein